VRISKAPVFREKEKNSPYFYLKKPKKLPKITQKSEFQGGSVQDRMNHVLYCFQQMEEEALINEKLHSRKLEREIKLEIREKIGYSIKPLQKQDGVLRTNYV
jgi:hypothetical protein